MGYYFDDPAGEVLSVYSLEPLMEKVSEVWACDKVKELQKMRQALKEQGVKISPKKAAGQTGGQFTNLCQSFEKEFDRPVKKVS